MENNITCYELMPMDGRKSFYGKAKVFVRNGWIVLKSYDTYVCAINSNGEFLRYWNGYSATTARHIAAFCYTHGISAPGKSEWLAMPVLRFSWVDFYMGKVA